MLESPTQRAPESLTLAEIQDRHLKKPIEATRGEQALSVLCMRCFDGLIGTHAEAGISRSLCSQYHTCPLSERKLADCEAKEHTLN